MADYTIKTGEKPDPLRVVLRDYAGVVIDLTGCTVTIRVARRSTWATRINAAASIVSPATSGTIEFAWTDVTWAVADLGDYVIDFKVVRPGGTEPIFPKPGYLSLLVERGAVV